MEANETPTTEPQEIVHDTTLFAEPIAHIGPPASGFTVTNSLATAWGAVLIIVILVLCLKKSMKEVPGKLQHAFEIIFGGALDLADQVTGDRRLTNKIFPLAIAVFFFVLVNNWLGILPGAGSIGQVVNESGEHVFVPFLRSGTADINTTLALAIFSVLGANIFGIVMIGGWKMFNKYVNLKALGGAFGKIKHDPTILIIAPITFFVGILELVGEFAKLASLSFRLFGNVFAGEVLLASMAAILAYGLPVPFLFLEVLVGVIQALIFAMLTLVYFTIAAQDHDEHHEESEEERDAERVAHA